MVCSMTKIFYKVAWEIKNNLYLEGFDTFGGHPDFKKTLWVLCSQTG